MFSILKAQQNTYFLRKTNDFQFQDSEKPIFPKENQCFPSSKGAIDSHRGWVKLEGGNRLAPASLPRIRERAIGLAPQIVKLQGGNKIRPLDPHHGRAIDLHGQ